MYAALCCRAPILSLLRLLSENTLILGVQDQPNADPVKLNAQSCSNSFITARRIKSIKPVDSSELAPEFTRAYFTTPRPVFELYDLENDLGELNNLAGQREFAAIERELKAALQEKMILDYDYLPLPIADKGEQKRALVNRRRNDDAGAKRR